MNDKISIFVAFGAGLLSFLSPCVLPLIPSYLSFIGGTAAGANERGRTLLAHTAGFIAGFSAVFIVMSLLFSGTFLLLSGVQRAVSSIAGLAVILLGLNMLFDFLSFVNYEKRFHLKRRPQSVLGAALAGAAFGAGWTPCVGPILGSILLMAGQSGAAAKAALYLAAYSAGLGLPFLAAAVFFDRFLAGAAKLRSAMPLIQRLSGGFLIITGAVMLLGRFQFLNILFIKGEQAFIAWAQGGGLPARLVPALVFLCAAALPPLIRLIRKRSLKSPALLIGSGCWGLLTIIQAAGILDSAGLVAGLLLYRQGV